MGDDHSDNNIIIIKIIKTILFYSHSLSIFNYNSIIHMNKFYSAYLKELIK